MVLQPPGTAYILSQPLWAPEANGYLQTQTGPALVPQPKMLKELGRGHRPLRWGVRCLLRERGHKAAVVGTPSPDTWEAEEADFCEFKDS